MGIYDTDPEDRRSLRIFLTEKAKALRDQLGSEREGTNDEVLRALSVEEKVLLKRMLREIRG